MGGILTIFGISGFWTYKSNEIIWSVFQMHRLAIYPIEIYHKVIRILITFILPFAFISYYPTLEYLGKSEVTILPILIAIAIAVWCIAIKVWNFGLKKYRSTGT